MAEWGMINPHQMVVHFPVALAVVGAAMEWWGLWRPALPWSWAGRWVMTFAALGGVAAWFSGGWAEHDAEKLGVVESVIERHEQWGTATAVILVAYAVSLWTWLARADATWKKTAIAAGALAAALGVALTGHYGGEVVAAMVYR